MANKYQAISFFLLLVVVIFFSLYKLTESPPVWYDEGIYIQTAANLAESGQAGLQVAPQQISSISHITVGYPLLYPLALAFKFFGSSVLVARLVMMLFIISLIVASYFLVKKLFGYQQAILAMLLLATFPPLYGNGKSVLGEVPGLLFLLLFLISLFVVQKNRRWSSFLLAGLLAGLCVVTKPLYLLLIPAAGIVMIISWRRLVNYPAELVGGIIAFGLPVWLWLSTQFTSEDSFGSIFGFYANPYGITTLPSTILHNLKPFFIEIGPAYLLIMLIIWLTAIIIRWRKNISVSLVEWISLIFTLLTIAAFLRTAGWYRYLFPAQIIVLLYFPANLIIIGNWLKIINTRLVVTAISILLMIIGLYQLGFHSWVADSYTSHKTAFWMNYFANLQSTPRIFFYDTPEVAIFDRNHNYYQYLEPAGVVIGQDQLLLIEQGVPDQIITKTTTFTSRQEWFTKHYRVASQPYKYTILEKTKI